ncbi:E3 ubiquitin-protein ligase At1g12760 isoform X2 [Arachis ipaensis]|uniref:E3 ubiquitin-protein ligase At1g12760 isoform X2 n=1 Tax=Arachis ipaensis TaxID=130454 RepID=UPI000A2B562F|nr:E3 ubiquitin-protein ligase At1g12760 isoform X2 [Arachis ipaensis]XP_029149496.1 E3 ubiquitin-protein ligase At1g12760 isoform X2 [Arachis hypogaea]
MHVLAPEVHIEGPPDTSPLLMERLGSLNSNQHMIVQPERLNDNQHIIDINIAGNGDASTSGSAHDRHSNGVDTSQHVERAGSVRVPVSQPSVLSNNGSNGSNSRNSSFIRRGDSRRSRSPVHSGLWISVELALLVSQIVASIVVLSLSRHEHPRSPLFAWIVGYASGCLATLPLLYWRYYHHNQSRDQDSPQTRQTSPRVNDPSGTFHSSSRSNGGADGQAAASLSRSNQASPLTNRRLCIVFLAFSCIGYAMPFILCSTICCCLPCIISILGVREDMSQNRGATSESINALPTYKFKMKKNKRSGDSNSAVVDGGVVAAGTEKERVISGDDAVCCICLAKYENNDELRELPCSHLFHKDCVDKWLKINALCPLCKSEVGENLTGSGAAEGASQ